MSLEKLYIEKCVLPSDIYEHLPTLRDYASRVSSIVECGVRDVVSSYAFACGLKYKPNNVYRMVDPYKSNAIDGFLSLCQEEGVNATFHTASDLDVLFETEMIFIDTWHVYGQLKRELAHWHSSVSKYIVLHDTTVDAIHGETLRMGMNASKQSQETGIPVHEITRGLWPAVEEFLAEHPEWKLEHRYTNNNGLTILRRVV